MFCVVGQRNKQYSTYLNLYLLILNTIFYNWAINIIKEHSNTAFIHVILYTQRKKLSTPW